MGVNKHCERGKVNIAVVQDKHDDFGLYINDLRVAGNKPWCGGRIVKEFVTNEDTILAALNPNERNMRRIRGVDDSMNTIYMAKFKCRKCESERTALIPDTFTVEQLLTKLSHVAKTDCPVCGEEPYDNWLFVGVGKARAKNE